MRLSSLRFLIALAALSGLLLASSPAHARSSYLSAFSSRYPNTKLDSTLGCNLCHPNGDTGSYTAYAKAFKSKSGTTSSKLQQIEGLDSDGDGYTNLQEINANTNPSSSSSHPTPTPTPTPTPRPTATPTPTPTPTPRPTVTPTPTPRPTVTPTPTPTPSTQNPYEIQAMKRMIDIHYTAVQFADIAKNKATHAELRSFAWNLRDREKVELVMMLDWLRQWFGIQYMPQALPNYAQQVADYQAQSGAELDTEALEYLLCYENQEMYLARQLGRRASHADLKAMALNIVDDNKAEIPKMQSWLTAWSGASQ